MEMNALQPADRERIVAAIAAAEANTAGEIYVVIRREAADFRFISVLWAALAALPLPWPLHLLTTWSTTTILLVQAGTFVTVATVASLPPLHHRLVPPGIAAEAVRKDAHAQFLAHGIHLTQARTGVLIYVALAERRVEIVADDGIHGKVDQSAWDALARAVVEAAKAGRLGDGLVDAVRGAGELLARHFPRRPGDRNELPNRVVEM